MPATLTTPDAPSRDDSLRLPALHDVVRRRTRSTPWTAGQLGLLIVADGVAAIMVLAGAWEASLGRTTQQALGWLLLPLAGLGLSGEAHGIWLAVNRQLIRGASAVVTELLEGLSDRPTDRAANEDVVTFLAVKGSPRFHRPACAFVQGREVIRLRSRDAVSKHEACEVCLP